VSPRAALVQRAANGNANGAHERAVAANGGGAISQAPPRGPGSNALQPENDAKTSAAQQKQAQQAERLKQGSGTAMAPDPHQQPMEAPPHRRTAAVQKPEQAQEQHAPTAPKQNGTSEDNRKAEDSRKEPKP
jgi:hypothetical protein